ncbi:MAG: hypothetical protein ACR2NA_00275 [Solirubrobacterales bacterium]
MPAVAVQLPAPPSPATGQRTPRRKAGQPRCEDCFFRQNLLCALAEGPCPTFRQASPEGLVPPAQLTLLERQRPASVAPLGLRDLPRTQG